MIGKKKADLTPFRLGSYLLRHVQKAKPELHAKWGPDLILRVFYSLELSLSLLWPVLC